MRKAAGGFEEIVLGCAALLSLMAAGAVWVLTPRLHIANDRVLYGLHHLPVALGAIFLFVALTGVLRFTLARTAGVAERSSGWYLAAVAGVFCLCWMPVWLAGGFVQDDWMLLAAASIRKIIYLHPGYSWYALDSVDGNFRPLGTVLYFGYMLKWFGASAHAFLTGNFVLNLLGSLVAFLVVRELGYSKVTGAAASLLYMTRGMTYTIVAWASALGDDIAIVLCGLMALAILKANKRQGAAAAGFHLLAWVAFALATLGKQSSFAAPLIVALLLYLRPGTGPAAGHARRLGSGVAGLLVYAAAAAIPYFHAKALLQAKSPYPIEFSVEALMRSFSFATWYFLPLEFPTRMATANLLPRVLGVAIVAGLMVLAWKVPRLLGERPRDIVFASLAAVASVSLFIVLGTRTAPYYGSMAAFWISIALGIGLTRFGAPRVGNMAGRLCCVVFCVLVAGGFADIRIKQTGLISSGGYTWGTYGMDRERGQHEELQRLLAASGAKGLVLEDFPGYPSYYASMAVMDDPGIERILIYDSGTHAYLANSLQGGRPRDGLGALNDPLAYNWTTPMDATDADRWMAGEAVLRLKFHGDNIEAVNSTPTVPR